RGSCKLLILRSNRILTTDNPKLRRELSQLLGPNLSFPFVINSAFVIYSRNLHRCRFQEFVAILANSHHKLDLSEAHKERKSGALPAWQPVHRGMLLCTELVQSQGISSHMVTLRDVAKRSGYSVSTVSIVLNDAPLAQYIPAGTKRRIKKVADGLSYR